MAQHHLQRLASPSPTLSLLWHLIGIGSFALSFKFLFAWDTPISRSYGWNLQFLTIISLTLSLVVFVLGAVADLTRSATLFGIKNAISIVTTPLEVVVTILYFGISAIDPTLVAPPEYAIPLDVDLGFHLFPAVLLVVDFLFFSPPWVIGAPAVMFLSTAFGFGYWYWVELCYSKNGWYGRLGGNELTLQRLTLSRYTYPIFGLLTTPQRAGLFIASAVLVTITSSVLKATYAKLNGSHMSAQKGSAKKNN